jgi:peptide-methionine (R)-S-oxide reductase
VSEDRKILILPNGSGRDRRESHPRPFWDRTAVLFVGFGLLFTGFAGALAVAFFPYWNGLNQGSIPVVTQPTRANSPQHDPKDLEYREKLSAIQYYVTRERGTERPFSGKYWNHGESGIYKCVCCGTPLFDSKDKFDSKTGWPSFDRPHDENQIRTTPDVSLIETRSEVLCRKCNAHLGHVFEDGPRETTGLRYCINSAALDFQKDSSDQAKAH